ncbi:HEAT repeat domain-containing protein [Desulfococcaceae bacterium HSG8]|nr:HEAT repeat domain-containing protein [Desulfococcaceae bacterium HSG8]
MKPDKHIKPAIILSLIYIIGILFLGNHIFFLCITACIIFLNFYISLSFLLKQGKITSGIILLNLVQLLLFCRLHIQIYNTLGPSHYSWNSLPRWYDWAELIGVHVLRAVDVIDFMEAYGIRIQNIRNQSISSGLALFAMHIMVDIFILGALFNALSRWSKKSPTAIQFMEEVEKTVISPKTFLFAGIMVVGYIMGYIFEYLSVYSFKMPLNVYRRLFSNFFLWPLDNFLRVADFGDAFQIFGWRLHSMKTTLNSATVAVYFRFIIGFYMIGIVNHFYLRILGGQGKTVDDLASICVSHKYSVEERLIALRALKKFDSYAELVIPGLISSMEDEEMRYDSAEIFLEIGQPAIHSLIESLAAGDADIRDAIHEILEKIDPDWPRSKGACQAIPHLVKSLADDRGHVRFFVAGILEKIDPHWPRRETVRQAVPHLAKSLEDRRQDVRFAAACTLEKIGPLAERAVFRLVKVLADEHEDARNAAAGALESIRPRWQKTEDACFAIPHLVEMLIHESKDVRNAASDVLEKISPKWHQSGGARSTIPYLTTMQTYGENETMRQAARNVLKRIDPAAESEAGGSING